MKLLLVEDFAPLRTALHKGLTEAGFVVDAAADGEEGLWFAGSADYDVIVLDLMLPRIDGWTVLERLRAARSPAHVLVLTARDAVEDRVRGLRSGADDYLVKPFAFEELLARVQALVRRRYDVKSARIDVGDLTVDREARRVWRGERDVALTGKQFALLELLALRAGKVVERSELWSRLYAFDEEPSSNLLDVYVAQVRKALESGGEPRIIHTHRGVGYELRGAS